MATDASLPQSVDEALSRGFLRFGSLPTAIQQAVERARNSGTELIATESWPCPRAGPCSVIHYPGGITEICYCNAANQCDDCVFQHS